MIVGLKRYKSGLEKIRHKVSCPLILQGRRFGALWTIDYWDEPLRIEEFEGRVTNSEYQLYRMIFKQMKKGGVYN